MLDEIMVQVQRLSAEERLRLIQRIAETILDFHRPPRPPGPGLVFGIARGGPRMSTPEDFGLPPDPTPEAQGNGP